MPDPIIPPIAPAPAPAAPTSTALVSAPAAAPESGSDDAFAAALDSAIGQANDAVTLSSKGGDAPKPDGGVKVASAAAPASPKLVEKKVEFVAKVPDKATPAVPPKEPKELRAELETTRKELQTVAEAKAALEAKISDYEKRGLDATALSARLKQRDDEYEALRGEIRMLKQEASPEYKEKYETPINEAVASAQTAISRLSKTDGTKPDFWKDVKPIFDTARVDYNKAVQDAKELFGDDGAGLVMRHVDRLDDLQQSADRALAKEKTGWKERQAAEDGLKVQQREAWEAARQSARKDLADTVEEYRDPPEDKESAASRQKLGTWFDAAPKDAKEAIVKAERIRHTVQAFGPMRLTISRLKAELSKLKTENEGLKPPLPGSNGHARHGVDGVDPHKDETDEQFYRRTVLG